MQDYINTFNSKSQVTLADYIGSKRAKEFNYRKQMALKMADLMAGSGNFEKASRLRGCGLLLAFASCEDGSLEFLSQNECRVRLCPVCIWRKSRRMFAENKSMFSHLDPDMKKYGYMFLTLTTRNVKAEELTAEITRYTNCFKRYIRLKPIKKILKGAMRAIEITYNAAENTYHVHLHAILAVNPSYFKSRDYLKHEDWRQLWAGVLNADYLPMVNIKRIRPDGGALAEISKYPTKSTPILNIENQYQARTVLAVLDSVLAYRQLITYWGCFAKARKECKAVSDEEIELIISERRIAAEKYLHYFTYDNILNQYYLQ